MIRPRWIGLIAGVLLVLGGTPVAAQSAADAFFHEAAQRYVDGDVQAARQAVERGLEVAPSDARLLALQERLQQEGGRQGGGRSSQGDTQDGPQPSPAGQGPRDEGSEASEQDSRATPNDASDSQSSQGPDAGASNRAERDENEARRRPRDGEDPPTNALSRTQAARLLRALENQETRLLREVRGQAPTNEIVEKDW